METKSIVDTFRMEEEPKSPAPTDSGEWLYCYADDPPSTCSERFSTEADVIAAAKEQFLADDEEDSEILILRVAKRLKVFKYIEVREQPAQKEH